MLNAHGKRLFVLFFMVGLLLTMQVRILSKGVKHIGVENIQETVRAVEKEKAEIEQLQASLDDANSQLVLYEQPSQVNDSELLNQLEKKRRMLKQFLNYTNVAGPGVVVIINDADRELMRDEPGYNILVHDQDISIIVDELRQAGAEAISINDTRIVFNSTKIVCVGPTVKINGEQMAAPFIIKAIGNRKHLEAAINAPDTYAEFLGSYGLFVEVNTSISVEISKYDGLLNHIYMSYHEEGEN